MSEMITLDKTWDYTKRMWRWITFQKEVLQNSMSVGELKHVWLNENTPEYEDEINANCFFCDYSTTRRSKDSNICSSCPGRLVDENFTCKSTGPCHYESKPGAFYKEILRLDKIRTAKPLEHVWEHGDVFKYFNGAVMIYIQLECKAFVYCLHPGSHRPAKNYHPQRAGDSSYLNETVEFLFNIKDKL